MAETVKPNAAMLQNTLDALAARNVQRIMLSGGAKCLPPPMHVSALLT